MADDRNLAPPLPAVGIGLDLGSTLAKFAVATDGALHLSHVPVTEEASIRATLADHRESPLALTGVRAATWAEALAERKPLVLSEFDATGLGARVLLARAGQVCEEPFLVASVGTGTSVLCVDGDNVWRVGGTALGGGTLEGLGELLCGAADYAALAALAAAGDRHQVDLLVRDVYPQVEGEMLGALTAANFGRVRSRQPADVAHGLCGLVGENLGLLCGTLARLHKASHVWFCGGTITANSALAGILLGTTRYAGAEAQILEDGLYCAAVGGLAGLVCAAGPEA